MKLPCAYQMGRVIYLRIDPDGCVGMITEIRFIMGGTRIYKVVWSDRTESCHHEPELTTVRSFASTEETSTVE